MPICLPIHIRTRGGKEEEEGRGGGKLIYCECVADECYATCVKNADNGIGWWCKDHYQHSNIRHYIIISGRYRWLSYCCQSCADKCIVDFYNEDDDVDDVDIKLCPGCDECKYKYGPYTSTPTLSD